MSAHRDAVERAVAAGGSFLSDDEAPLIELCRSLAAQMDDSEGDPSTRLSAAYLSALKDVRRVLGRARATCQNADDKAPGSRRVAGLRAAHGGRR